MDRNTNNNNSSTSSEPFDIDSFNFDDDILQQLLSDLPSTTSPQFIHSQSHAPISTTSKVVDPLNINSMIDHRQIESLSQMDEPPPSGFAGSSSSGYKGKQHQPDNKIKAVDSERQRRREMSGLYKSLRSILPATYIKGKRSTADHLQEAVKYIKDLEENIAKLNEKRDSLVKVKSKGSSFRRTSNSTSTTHNLRQHCITVNKCREGFFEIVLRSNGDDYEDNARKLPLSKGLRLLVNQGFNVTSTLSNRVGNNVIHTIHAEVDEGRGIDRCLLQQQLIDCYV